MDWQCFPSQGALDGSGGLLERWVLDTEPDQPSKREVDLEGLSKPKTAAVYVGHHLSSPCVGKAQTGKLSFETGSRKSRRPGF